MSWPMTTTSTSNPFTEILAGASNQTTIPPTKGFKARLIVLGALAFVTLIGTIVHGVCRHLSAARKGEGVASFWLVRRIERASGRFLVLNPVMLREICGIVLSVLTAVIVSVAWKVFFHGAQVDPIYNWTEATYWPVAFILSWCTSVANLQVYLLLRDDRAAIISARTTNLILFGWLVIGAAGCFAILGYQLASSARIHSTSMALFGFLYEAQATWQAGDDTTQQIATVHALEGNFFHALDTYIHFESKAWGVYIVAQASTIVVTLATYPLVLSLQAQIKATLGELHQQANYVAAQSVATQGDTADVIYAEMTKVPTLSQVKVMAEKQWMSLEAAKRLRTMSRIVSDLQIQLGAFLAIAVTLVAGCSFFTFAYSRLSEEGWPAKEMILFFPLYCLLVPHAIAFVFLATNSIRELHAQKTISRATTSAIGTQRHLSFVGIGGAALRKSAVGSEVSDCGVEVVVECVTREDKDEESLVRKQGVV